MWKGSPDEIRDTLPARQLASQATPTGTLKDIDPHIVGSDASHYLADVEPTHSDPHDPSESFHADTSIDDQGDDEERYIEVLSNSDWLDDLSIEQGVNNNLEEWSGPNSSSSGASHYSARTGDGTVASKAFGHVPCLHPGLEDIRLIVAKCVEFPRSRIHYHIG